MELLEQESYDAYVERHQIFREDVVKAAWLAERARYIASSALAETEALKQFDVNHPGTPADRPKACFGEVPDGAVTITKAAPEEQLVFGWANVAIKADGSLPIDWQGDLKTPEVLEKAAYQFVLKSRVANEMHESNDEVRGNLVESVMFTKEKMSAMGIPEGTVPEGWWVGFHIPDPEVFAKVKNGQYKMFSIEGQAQRIPLEHLLEG